MKIFKVLPVPWIWLSALRQNRDTKKRNYFLRGPGRLRDLPSYSVLATAKFDTEKVLNSGEISIKPSLAKAQAGWILPEECGIDKDEIFRAKVFVA